MTSSRISTIARAIVYPHSENKLVELVSRLKDIGAEYIVLGKMSNILVRGGKYNGIVLRTSKIDGYCVAENILNISCGSNIGIAARKSADLDLGGMEGLIGIPGSVGGMVKQNAGAFGYEIADRFISATCYIPDERSVVKISKDDMRFSYRDSMLKHTDAVLLNATFELIPKRYNDVIEEINEYRVKRNETQPIKEPSLGSVFKRYEGVSSGYYIDRAGLKGYTVGGASVSRKHAGFIVNNGCATAEDFLNLIKYVKERVFQEFNIELEEEIEII